MSVVDDRETTSSQRAALNDFAWVESVPVRHLSMLEVQHFQSKRLQLLRSSGD